MLFLSFPVRNLPKWFVCVAGLILYNKATEQVFFFHGRQINFYKRIAVADMISERSANKSDVIEMLGLIRREASTIVRKKRRKF